ncbi:MAG: hypothetical protein ACK5XN_05755 [Bacteroidota bacterium]|jgi:hypothetical protein
MTIPPQEIMIPRTWHGTHLSGVHGYELAISDEFIVSTALQSNGIISCIIIQGESEARYFATNIQDMLQWIANTIKVPVFVDDLEAVYPDDHFDDGDDEDFTEEEFDDGDDEDFTEEDASNDESEEKAEPEVTEPAPKKTVDKKKEK